MGGTKLRAREGIIRHGGERDALRAGSPKRDGGGTIHGGHRPRANGRRLRDVMLPGAPPERTEGPKACLVACHGGMIRSGVNRGGAEITDGLLEEGGAAVEIIPAKQVEGGRWDRRPRESGELIDDFRQRIIEGLKFRGPGTTP